MKKLLKTLLALAMIAGATFQASATTFDFAGAYSMGTNGNIRNFSKDGISVNVSAWNSDSSGGNWSAAALGQFAAGLGVGNANDATDGHTADNEDSIDYILFEFSEIVAPDSALLKTSLSWSSFNDSDITLWIGTFTDPFTSHLDLASTSSTSDFSYLEFNSGSLTRVADFNNGWQAGNALLISGDINQSDDAFKLTSLSVPDNGATLTLLGLALVGVFFARSRSLRN